MKLWARMFIGFLLFAVLLYFVDWRQTVTYLLQISPGWAVLALFILTLNIPLSSYKWKILLEAQGNKAALWVLTRCYWIGTFFGNFLPSSVGGDAARLVLMKDYGSKTMMAASIVWERVTGFFVLIVWSAIGLIGRPQYFDVGHVLPVLWMAVGAGAFAIVCFWFFARKIARLLNILPFHNSKLFNSLIKKTLHFADAVDEYREKRKTIFIAVICSIPFYVVGIFFNYFVINAVGADLPIKEIFFLLPIIPLISFIPISFNGLGVSEGAFVIFYSQAGLQPSEALAAAILRRLIHLLISLEGGLLWIPLRSSKDVELKKI